MVFLFEQKIKFKHCDPAGIVFYPRYFEMMNDCVEAFFEQKLLWPFEELHETHGVPTVSISTQFKAPSRHGEILNLTLDITKIGRTSMDLITRALSGSELRFETYSTLVSVDTSGLPKPWPAIIRSRIQQFMEGET